MTLHAHDLTPPATPAQRLKLGLLTPHNVYDHRAFSGTVYHAARAMMRHPGIDLKLLGDHHPPRFAGRLTRRLGRKRADSMPSAQDLAGLDAVIGLVASGLLDRLPGSVPFFHVSDATPGFLAEAYGWDIPEDARACEARIAARAVACLYSSDVMAARARRELAPAMAETVPFGINIADTPTTRPEKPPFEPLELVYVGVNWERKGGAIALATLDHLRADGIKAHLTLVGQIPDHVRGHPGVTVVDYLDKTRGRDLRRLTDIYTRAHLLVLPTRGDCTPIVIGEAMAFGTPVLATATGGIPEMLGGDGTGRTLPLDVTARDWAHTIREMTDNRQAWDIAADAAFDRAQSRFSWNTWADRIVSVAREGLVAHSRAA